MRTENESREPRIEAVPADLAGKLTCERCERPATVYLVIWDEDEGAIDFEYCETHGNVALAAEREPKCPRCHGDGLEPHAPGAEEADCRRCGGTGGPTDDDLLRNAIEAAHDAEAARMADLHNARLALIEVERMYAGIGSRNSNAIVTRARRMLTAIDEITKMIEVR
jgi:hypothetical protein